MNFNYRVWFTQNGKRYVSNCAKSLNIANAVACRRLADGATDVVIEVTKGDESDEPPSSIEEVNFRPAE